MSRLYLSDAETAILWFQQADLSGPDDPGRWTWLQGLGRALLHAGRPEEAVAVLRTLVECHPDWPFSHGLLALALAWCGDVAAAQERFGEFVRRAPHPAARAPGRLVPVPVTRLSAAYRACDARILERFAELEEGVLTG